jgi:pimeloyl-ACP methyl ester carboxylesterase
MTRPTARALLLTAAAAVAGGCGGGGHPTSSPPIAGLVAYSARGDVWVMHGDGSDRRRLTRTPDAVEFGPRFSPDGRRVAYLRQRRSAGPTLGPRATDLVEVPVAGGRSRLLARRPEAADLVWAPDGRIVFSARDRLYALSGHDAPPRPIGRGGCARWSSDGRAWATCVGGRSPDTTSLEVRTARSPRDSLSLTLPGTLSIGGFSPDGRRVAFSAGPDGDGDVYVTGVSDRRPHRLVGWPGNQSAAGWLVDGRILFSDSRRGRSTRWLVLRPGGRPEALAQLAGAEDPIDVWPGSRRGVRPPEVQRAFTPQPAGLAGARTGRMGLDCRGSGPATAVLISGLGVPAEKEWGRVMAPAATVTRVCRYDRPGLGATPRTARARTAGAMADDLWRRLRRTRVAGPYVPVGASFGGLIAQILAHRHRHQIAGMVLVDSLHPDLDRLIGRVIGARAARLRRRILTANAEGLSWRDILRSDGETRAARPLPDVPLLVLVHGLSFDPGGRPVPALERLWRGLQRGLAGLSRHGRVVIARASHHRIAEDQPRVVVGAIRAAVRRWRPAPGRGR